MATVQSNAGSTAAASSAAASAAAGVAVAAAASTSASYSSSSSDLPEITLADGSKYRGELSAAGKPHGQGRLQDTDGSVYEGSLKVGQRDGLGQITARGQRYEGEWREDNPDGLGAVWDKEGKLVGCGRWAAGLSASSCAVPFRCLPEGKHLSAAALQAKRDHPNDSALFPSDSHYIGELNEQGQPHGIGASFQPDGSPAITLIVDAAEASNSGRWIEGMLHGRACHFLDGDVYEGMFKDSNFNGLGVLSWAGSRYEGEFVDDQFSGLGARWGKDGKLVKCGRWKEGLCVKSRAVPLRSLPEGNHLSVAALQAKHDHPNSSALMHDGSYYIGELNADGQPHGQGASFHPDGSPDITLLVDAADASNSGRWAKGKAHGRATRQYLSGNRYEGRFKDSNCDGLGVFSWKADGSRYEGEFVAGKCSGLGAKWDKDGKLIGCWRWTDGQRVESRAVPLHYLPECKHLSPAAVKAKRDHPNDSALMSDGTHYIGQLNADGQPHGQGASFHPDGSPEVTLLIDSDARKSGRWVDGKVHGRASILFANGTRYEGMFKDFEFDVLGVYCWEDGRRYEGEFVANKRSGLGALWDKDGKLINCGRWEKDKLARSAAPMLT